MTKQTLKAPEGYIYKQVSDTEIQLVEIAKNKSKEERFLELVEGLTIKTDKEKYPNSTFWFKGDRVFLELENSILWVRFEGFWDVFKDKYDDKKVFIKSMIEKHFKMKGVTPNRSTRRKELKIEKHFKMKGVTPSARLHKQMVMIEKHFKNKQ